MLSTLLRRAALAIGIASLLVPAASTTTLAQDYSGSTVTTGGGVSGVGNGKSVAVAPGVVISGGNVSNSTGIGVDASGGSSIGATGGGSDSAAAVQ
jgi:hypothetical protein